MKLFAISNRGLAVIGALVMLLWGVIFAERVVIQQAQRDQYEFLQSRPHRGRDATPRPTSHPRDALPAIPIEKLSQTSLSSPSRV